MFDGVKKMFGGGLDISAMIGPMLPGIIKDAAPKMVEAFDQKVLELENSLEFELIDEEEQIEEVAAFLTKRNGKLQLDWVVLGHKKQTNGSWDVTIVENLETLTQDDFFAAALQSLGKPQAPVMQLPEPLVAPELPAQLHAISEVVKQAPIDPQPFEQLPDIQSRHDRYKNERFVVFSTRHGFLVEQGPVVGPVIWYGHQDEAIAQNWADVKNRELKGQ